MLYQARIQDFLKGGGVKTFTSTSPPLDIVCVTSSALQKNECHPHIVKKFVEKKIGGREQGGSRPPPPGSAPVGLYYCRGEGGGSGQQQQKTKYATAPDDDWYLAYGKGEHIYSHVGNLLTRRIYVAIFSSLRNSENCSHVPVHTLNTIPGILAFSSLRDSETFKYL